MGKKKVIRDYTQEEKLKKLVVIRKKLRDFGLGVYQSQCDKLGKIMNNYVKNNIEYEGFIPLPGSQRKMDIYFRNCNRYEISITLVYDKTV